MERPVGFDEARVAAAVAGAPPLPVDLGLDLKLRLVDYVDFTDPDEFHDFFDRGTSRVVDGPAGRYRETARHRHAMFSVRWRADAIDRPHLLVFEYPDDADRQIAFLTHESRLTGRYNVDWSLETGVNCGDPYPPSGRMQYHTSFFWPADRYPAALVMNWSPRGVPAAARRLWVFAIDGGLPPLKVEDPDPENPRILGCLYNWSLVPLRGIYGLSNPETALEHLIDYHLYRGENLLSWPVVANNDWGFRCRIPAWDGGDQSEELDRVLRVCERRGMKFLPVFNTGFDFRLDGRGEGEGDPEERRALFEEGFRRFVERYGSSPTLYGIAFDTQDLSAPYGEAALDQMRRSFGDLKTFREFLRSIAPDLPVFHFLGGRHIHDEYFPDAGAVLRRWEDGSLPWDEFLGAEADRLWCSWGRDPAAIRRTGIGTILAYQVDDGRIFDLHQQNPRAFLYHDLEASRAKADLVNGRAAMVWNTFYEGYIGLTPENWWYRKLWVAPDFNPAPPLGLHGWILAMSHRDRSILLSGAWNRKAGGMEGSFRAFAQAYRALPSAELEAVRTKGSTPVFVRSVFRRDRRYVCLLNPTPFTQEIRCIGRAIRLSPFSMRTEISDRRDEPEAIGEASAEYVDWLKGRLDRFRATAEGLRALDPTAVRETYARHLARAQALFDRRAYREADEALGFALPKELELRLRILRPETLGVPRIGRAPAAGEDLDAWDPDAADWRTDDRHMVAGLYLPTPWEGKDDLSARIRAGWDGENLYIGIRVRDQVVDAKDGVTISFSPERYREWAPQRLESEYMIFFPAPAEGEPVGIEGPLGIRGTSTPLPDGYRVTVVCPLARLPLRNGDRIGWLLRIADDDGADGVFHASWARKQELLFPNDPLFAYHDDARSCSELRLEGRSPGESIP